MPPEPPSQPSRPTESAGRCSGARMLAFCRYLALVYAVGLAIGEAVINSSREQWQFAPMWIIDYVIVAYLFAGFWATRCGRNIPILMSAYALSAGVLYIAFFVSFDPEFAGVARAQGVVLVLMGGVLGVSAVGLAVSTLAWYRWERGGPSSPFARADPAG